MVGIGILNYNFQGKNFQKQLAKMYFTEKMFRGITNKQYIYLLVYYTQDSKIT